MADVSRPTYLGGLALHEVGHGWMHDTLKYIGRGSGPPQSHFMPKPRPPRYVGRDTIGHDVDSSAIVCVSGVPYKPRY